MKSYKTVVGDIHRVVSRIVANKKQETDHVLAKEAAPRFKDVAAAVLADSGGRCRGRLPLTAVVVAVVLDDAGYEY